jgi:DNA-binding transcriptional regulator YiaG
MGGKFNEKSFKSLRERMGLNQFVFGRLFGFSEPQKRVSEIELGKKKVSNQVRMIARYLRILHAHGLIDLKKSED